ncbi:MAG: OB-fold domain-containing protein [Acidobacteriaceae bacterium]|nr:OB-fold domain-containing protein [Acidobacteriaceae bacterium]MBV9782029.1 OB-fold domain-containing protein [Acidobacteriaceae bacterium]
MPSAHGVVYTETVVHAPPEQYAGDAPYQLAIVDLENGGRLTVRILGKEPQDRARIGDRVEFVEERNGVSYYRRAISQSNKL